MHSKRANDTVITVLGPVDANRLGVTLPHEHILMDLTALFAEPEETTEKKIANDPVSIENLHWVCTHLMCHRDDLTLNDEDLAVSEIMRFKMAGGATIVDMSCRGLGRDPQGLARIARATGLNIVMAAGYYVGLSHPEHLGGSGVEKIAEEIVRDIVDGVGSTGVRAGVIGEIGCSLPLMEGEKKVLQASACAQRETGVAINVHPSRDDDTLKGIVSILDRGGADLRKVVISHVDHFGFADETLEEIAKAGCCLEFDTFGHPALPVEAFKNESRLLEMPSDVQRISHLKRFLDKGFLDQLMLSQDCCFKHKLVRYGGFGYAHIVNNVVPWMIARGITRGQIEAMLINNPARILKTG